MQTKFGYGLVAALAVVSLAQAAELGRRDLGREGMATREGVAVEKGYQYLDSDLGVELGLNWNAVNWKIRDNFSDNAWAPEASIFYGVNEIFDIRATMKYLSVADVTGDGKMKGDMNVMRIGIGSKAWIPTGSDFLPFVAVLLNYYTPSIDDSNVKNEDGMFGVALQAGCAYMINEWIAVQAAVHGETAIMDGSADVTTRNDDNTETTKSEDMGINALGLGVSLNVLF